MRSHGITCYSKWIQAFLVKYTLQRVRRGWAGALCPSRRAPGILKICRNSFYYPTQTWGSVLLLPLGKEMLGEWNLAEQEGKKQGKMKQSCSLGVWNLCNPWMDEQRVGYSSQFCLSCVEGSWLEEWSSTLVLKSVTCKCSVLVTQLCGEAMKGKKHDQGVEKAPCGHSKVENSPLLDSFSWKNSCNSKTTAFIFLLHLFPNWELPGTAHVVKIRRINPFPIQFPSFRCQKF